MTNTQPSLAEGESRSGFRHVDALDGLRGVAFLMVFLFHAYQPGIVGADHSWMGGALRWITGYGWLGVDLFFVLSGYLITGVLLGQRETVHYYRNFYARRALRIFPVYYLAVAVALLILPMLNPPALNGGRYPWTVQIWFWLNLSNLITAFNPSLVLPLTHFWSLAIEEQFYLVWPWLVRRLSRRALIGTTCGLLMAAEIGRNLPYVVEMNVRYSNFTYRLTPLHCDGLLFGALLALLLQRPEFLSPARLRRVFMVLPVATAAVLCGFVYVSSATVWGIFLSRWSFLAAGLFFASLLGLVVVCGPEFWFSRLFRRRFLRWIGALSYALYVVHLTMLHVGGLLVGRLPGLSAGAAAELIPPVSFALCVGVAMISRVLIERPALRLKRYFQPERQGAAAQ